MNDENLRRQEESVAKQEAMRKGKGVSISGSGQLVVLYYGMISSFLTNFSLDIQSTENKI